MAATPYNRPSWPCSPKLTLKSKFSLSGRRKVASLRPGPCRLARAGLRGWFPSVSCRTHDWPLLHLHSSTPPLLHTSTPLLLYSRLPSPSFSSPPLPAPPTPPTLSSQISQISQISQTSNTRPPLLPPWPNWCPSVGQNGPGFCHPCPVLRGGQRCADLLSPLCRFTEL